MKRLLIIGFCIVFVIILSCIICNTLYAGDIPDGVWWDWYTSTTSGTLEFTNKEPGITGKLTLELQTKQMKSTTTICEVYYDGIPQGSVTLNLNNKKQSLKVPLNINKIKCVITNNPDNNSIKVSCAIYLDCK